MENIINILKNIKNTNNHFDEILKEVSDNLNTLNKIIKDSSSTHEYYRPSLFVILENTISFKDWYRGVSFKLEDNRYDILGVKLIINDTIRLVIDESNSVTLNMQHDYLRNLERLNNYLKTQLDMFNL